MFLNGALISHFEYFLLTYYPVSPNNPWLNKRKVPLSPALNSVHLFVTKPGTQITPLKRDGFRIFQRLVKSTGFTKDEKYYDPITAQT